LDHLDQAFWTFLHRDAYFEAALLIRDVDAIDSDAWESHPNAPRAEPRMDGKATTELAKTISSYCKAVEGLDARCEVTSVEVEDRCYFSCVFEGPYVARSVWEPAGLRRRLERGVLPLIFVYEKQRRKLSVYVRGPSRRKWDLMSIFARVILGAKKLDPPSYARGSYSLERFKHRGRHVKIPEASGISVSVARLRLTPRLGLKRHITLQAQPHGETEPVYDLLEKELTSLKPHEFDVTQVEIKVVFSKTAHRRRRTIPTVLTAPNRCSIGYDDQELIVRRKLSDSGIEPIAPIEEDGS
jgi:hypothetical protein